MNDEFDFIKLRIKNGGDHLGCQVSIWLDASISNILTTNLFLFVAKFNKSQVYIVENFRFIFGVPKITAKVDFIV